MSQSQPSSHAVIPNVGSFLAEPQICSVTQDCPFLDHGMEDMEVLNPILPPNPDAEAQDIGVPSI